MSCTVRSYGPTVQVGTPRRGNSGLVPLPEIPSAKNRTPRDAALLVAKLNSGVSKGAKIPIETLRRCYTEMDLKREVKQFHREQKSLNHPLSARAPGACYGDGRVDPIAHAISARVDNRDLHGALGNYSTNCPSRTLSRSSLRTAYNDKAREGFKYWYMERPKPTMFGRYGIGSYKTVLGLGSAPRT